MELDNVKKLWEEVNLLKEKQQFNDDKIKEMLKNKGKTAIAKLKRLPIIGVVLIVPIAYLLYLQICDFYEQGILRAIFMSRLFLTLAIAIPMEIYLYRLLRGIDYSYGTIKNAYERILNYQNLVRKSELFGLTWAAVFIGSYAFSTYKVSFGTELHWGTIILVAMIFLGTLVAMPFMYKKLYYKRINQIKESLNELEEFEQN